jgi:RNA polymerase sigma factor (sigma-70 family)
MRDSEVVAAIVAGDPHGLAEAYDRYASPLYAYCRSLLREPADAADAVQDTFIIAASKLAGLRDRSRLRPWLYAVARNECHRRLRENASAATSALDLVPEMSDESADVAGSAERAELRALLRSAVRGLNAGEQDLIELQLQQELDVAEIAAVLGVSRNHAHALLSRARDQLEISLGALLVARSGRADCTALSALLEDWDGQLNVLMRKRINRHIERCPACTERKRRELAPALLLGLAPLAALSVAMPPPGLRGQVLRLVSSNTPEAAAHRASVAQRAVMSGPHGFPKPLDPPKSPWWRGRRTQGTAAAAVVAAAAVLTILALTGGLGGHHHGRLSALNQGSSVPGASGASLGGTAPGTQPGSPGSPVSPGSPGNRGSATQPSGPASAAAQVSPPLPAGSTPTPGGPSTLPPPGSQSPAPSHRPSPTSPAPTTSSARPTSTATSAAPTLPPAPGTLSVSPRTIVVSPLRGGTLTLTASGGPVSWFIAESSGLVGELAVSPTSGRLVAGQSTTVALSVSSVAAGLPPASSVRAAADRVSGGAGVCVGCQLVVNPGSIKVTVIIDISVGPSYPPPSSGNPDTDMAAGVAHPSARLVD